jgi:hypothetical protein
MAERNSDTRKRTLSHEPLLVSRKNAALMLGGISVATIIRMEARGALVPVRLNPNSTTSQVFYRLSDLKALVSSPS